MNREDELYDNSLLGSFMPRDNSERRPVVPVKLDLEGDAAAPPKAQPVAPPKDAPAPPENP